MNNKTGNLTIKTTHKYSLALTAVLAVAALVAGCKQMPLEQQIAEKEANSWDFKVAGGTSYIRIYDGPGKVGWFKAKPKLSYECKS